MDCVCVCVRIPKCGSTSLVNCLTAAFAGQRTFYLPHSIDLEGPISALQGLRFRRTRARNLFRRYRTFDIAGVYKTIETHAANGDLIVGGHVDFPSVRENIERRLKMIVMFRDPAERCRSEYHYCRKTYFQKPPLSRLDASLLHKMAGTRDFDSYLDFLLSQAPVYANLASRYIGWDGTEDLSRLFARDVFHSGVLERSEDFVRGLSAKTGVPVTFPHENRTGKTGAAKLTAGQRRKIERLYPLDFALYEWQLARLNEETEECSVRGRAAAAPFERPFTPEARA